MAAPRTLAHHQKTINPESAEELRGCHGRRCLLEGSGVNATIARHIHRKQTKLRLCSLNENLEVVLTPIAQWLTTVGTKSKLCFLLLMKIMRRS
jgi:hypothetical protein